MRRSVLPAFVVLTLAVAGLWTYVLASQPRQSSALERLEALESTVRAQSLALSEQARIAARQRAEIEALRARPIFRPSWDEGLQQAKLDRARVAQ